LRRSDRRQLVAQDDPKVRSVLRTQLFLVPRAAQPQPQALERAASDAVVDGEVDLVRVSFSGAIRQVVVELVD